MRGVSANSPGTNTSTEASKNYSSHLNNSVKTQMARTVDSTGRQLTKQQEEYFKDSKVRDKNRNPLVMYHGSVEVFSTFARIKYVLLVLTLCSTNSCSHLIRMHRLYSVMLTKK